MRCLVKHSRTFSQAHLLKSRTFAMAHLFVVHLLSKCLAGAKPYLDRSDISMSRHLYGQVSFRTANVLIRDKLRSNAHSKGALRKRVLIKKVR